MAIKETIILAPGANKTELLRSLALYGQGSFGIRIYNSAYNLAEEMLVRKGIINNNVVSEAEAQYVINNCMKQEQEFKNASFTDAINVSNSLKTLRYLIPDNEEEQMNRLTTESEFAYKNKAFLNVFKSYKKVITGRKDTVDVVREAFGQYYEIDSEFIRLKEFPLAPLEEVLLNRLSNNNVKEMSLIDLFGKEKKNLHDLRYVKAYGYSNEVEDVLNYIFSNNISLDDCVIAVTDSNRYGQLFNEYGQKYHFDVSLGRGISINNTNPARLLRMYMEWDINGYHGVDALKAMLSASCFDMAKLNEKFDKEVSPYYVKNTIMRAGRLKLGPDPVENKARVDDYIPLITNKTKEDPEVLKVLGEELGKDCVSFIQEYSVIRDSNDEDALRTIVYRITDYLNICRDGDYDDISSIVLSGNVGKSVSKSGALTVTDIRGALSVCRKHLFVLGLGANFFPGSVKENYLLLDDDLALYGNNVPSSTRIIEKKKEELYNLLDLHAALDSEITVSYSSYDLAAIKGQNASSVLFEIYKKEFPNGNIKEFDSILQNAETAYLQNKLSISSEVLYGLNNNQILAAIPKGEVVDAPYPKDAERVFSPSALELFFNCKKQFYISCILGIEEPDPDDPFTVIDFRDIGTLVHSAMEYLAAHPSISESEFVKQANAMFDDFLKTRVPISKESAEVSRNEYLNMVKNGYKYDPGNEVLSAEEKFSVTHAESGIRIYGYPDRVEKDKEGNYLIADYKTKGSYGHVNNDINTCLQVVLYAYMMSHRGKRSIPISYCTYRYLRFRDPVNCDYNKGIEDQLALKMNEVKEALDTGYFPCSTDKDSCKYCKFAAICGRDEVREVADDE